MTIEELIIICNDMNGSDIHLKVNEPPVCRLNGGLIRLNEYDVITEDDMATFLMEITNEYQRKTLENDMQVDFSFALFNGLRIRANVFKESKNLSMVFRILKSKVPDLNSLDVPQQIYRLTDIKSGLILVTGPTGSGKTTTLAGLINEMNYNKAYNILTLEDPIEYVHDSKQSLIRQRELGVDTHSFGDGLRAALREDPDVILVGELRDLDSISIALTAAETGHLVLGTLHTLGSAKTVDRLVDVFPTGQQQQIRVQLGSTLKAVVSQKLIPTEDGTGRVGAFEIMFVNTAISNNIREGKTSAIDSYIQTGISEGMLPFNKCLSDLCRSGKISREQAFENASDIKALEKYM